MPLATLAAARKCLAHCLPLQGLCLRSENATITAICPLSLICTYLVLIGDREDTLRSLLAAEQQLRDSLFPDEDKDLTLVSHLLHRLYLNAIKQHDAHNHCIEINGFHSFLSFNVFLVFSLFFVFVFSFLSLYFCEPFKQSFICLCNQSTATAFSAVVIETASLFFVFYPSVDSTFS